MCQNSSSKSKLIKQVKTEVMMLQSNFTQGKSTVSVSSRVIHNTPEDFAVFE